MNISIVVISYNSADFLTDNLESLARQTVPFKEIIIVDNASTDHSPSKVEPFLSRCPQLKTIALNYNSGYAGGANIGINACTSHLILVANSDTILAENFNETVVEKFQNDDTLAMLSPLILRFDKHTVDSAGQTYSPALHPQEIGYNQPITEVNTQEKPVFSVCGAATVFSREALERLRIDNDYYDEDFFIFWEDFDIGWRANLLGFNTLFYPEAVVYHYRSATLQRNFFARFSLALARPSHIKFHLVKNRYLTLIKNFRLKRFFFNIPFILLKDFIWVGLLTFSSPKIIIQLAKAAGLFKKAFRKRKLLKMKEKQEQDAAIK